MKCIQPIRQDVLRDLPHIGTVLEERFKDKGLPTFLAVAMAGVDAIKAVPGVKDHRAQAIWAAAVSRAFHVDPRGTLDDLCEVGAPFTEAESVQLARLGVHTYEQLNQMGVEQIVEVAEVSAVEAAAAKNQATFLFGQVAAQIATDQTEHDGESRLALNAAWAREMGE